MQNLYNHLKLNTGQKDTWEKKIIIIIFFFIKMYKK